MTAYPDEWNRANRISFGDVRRAFEVSTLSERGAILDFLRSNVTRIRPALDDEWLYDAMSTYLLECLATSPARSDDGDSTHTPFEAARELVRWFNWLVSQTDNASVIKRKIGRIETVFRSGDDQLRNCIETGFLEHVLETPGNRPLFSHWIDDPVLADSYTEALRWGEAHTKPNAP